MFTTVKNSSLLSATVFKHPGLEETSCWVFGTEMLLHFGLIYDSSCSTHAALNGCFLDGCFPVMHLH